jgi:hypothetical protein
MPKKRMFHFFFFFTEPLTLQGPPWRAKKRVFRFCNVKGNTGYVITSGEKARIFDIFILRTC